MTVKQWLASIRALKWYSLFIKTQTKDPEVERKSTFASIGGLGAQIEAIRESVELSLLHPERFTNYGLAPPKGLLLFGAPGTGKTMIARAVAAEIDSFVITVSGPEILSKFYGETEGKLKSIFDRAIANAPSIIFFDEIDALCPKREGSQNELEKKVVSCLLSLMDGDQSKDLVDRPRIFVIGATNRPNALDNALRRPGRFDREFEIGIPNAIARFEILEAICRPISHSLSLDGIKHVASLAHGYTGSDLAAVCREAGLITIKRVRTLLSSTNDSAVSEHPSLVITIEDMIEGMANVRPSVVREILLEVPKVYWTDIGGQDVIKQKLKEAIEWPLKHPELFVKFNIRPPKGLLLYALS